MMVLQQNLVTLQMLRDASVQQTQDCLTVPNKAFDLRSRSFRVGQWVDVMDAAREWVLF